MLPVKGSGLPSKTLPRLAALVVRSKPSSTRPRLSTESEFRLEDIETQKAACYANMEEMTYQFHDLAKQLRNMRENLERQIYGVVGGQITEELSS